MQNDYLVWTKFCERIGLSILAGELDQKRAIRLRAQFLDDRAELTSGKALSRQVCDQGYVCE